MRGTDLESKLNQLFAMEQKEIDADLKRYEGELIPLAEEIRSFLRLPLQQRTAFVEAKISHLMMIQAHGLCHLETLPVELKTFYAAFYAGQIADNALERAFEQGEVAKLSAQIDAIRAREGLGKGIYWMNGEGPEDHERLVEHQNRILEGIEDMVLVFFLRRYRLAEWADLFEQDRVAFATQREIGQRVVATGRKDPWDGEERMDKCFLKTYGAEALQTVHSRVQEILAAGV